jgi:hypothetical protein
MVDPQSPVGRVVSSNEVSENDGRAHMNLLMIHVRWLKGSDLLAHRTRIMYQKKRYMSIRN